MTITIDDTIQQAIKKYLEDNHGSVDPIGQRQIKSWNFEWMPTGTPADSDNCDDSSHYSGQVTWKSDNPEHPLILVLSTTCSWTDTKLDWTCRVRAEIATPPTDSKQKKIFKKLRERLEKDDYVAKLFVSDNKKKKRDVAEDNDDTSADGVVLAEASVQTPDSGLEERVFTDPDVAEGIRRSIWNTAQDPIEVLEFVIQYLPLLPCTTTSLPLNNDQPTTKLADRAVLRLLEDAMCDACDREGEDELVQDLHIQKKSRKEQG